MELTLRKEERLVLGQQMRQSMQLLQMSSLELEEYLNELAMENPLLEVRPPRERRESALHSVFSGERRKPAMPSLDSDEYLRPARNYETLPELIMEQIAGMRVPELMRRELNYLAWELDERGYLPEDAGDLRAFGNSRERYDNAVRALQSLEPAGVGARSLSECLRIQLRRGGVTDELPYKICESCLDRLAKGQLNHIAGELGVSIQRVAQAREIIAALEPRPSNGISDGGATPYVIPDVELKITPEGFELTAADRYMPSYGVDAYYAAMAEREELSAEEREYFAEKLRQAKWAVSCVSRRRDMLISCAREIVEAQRAFFTDGRAPLLPLTMTELSRRLEVHPSTVSRAVKGKYILCRWGVFPLSRFFAQELGGVEGSTGGDLTVGIRMLIAEEDPAHPLSDRELAERLSKRGLEVSRRTVAKYREAAMIPAAPGRRTRK